MVVILLKDVKGTGKAGDVANQRAQDHHEFQRNARVEELLEGQIKLGQKSQQ